MTPLPDLPAAWLDFLGAAPVTETVVPLVDVTETTEDVRRQPRTSKDTSARSLASQATCLSEQEFIEQCISKTSPPHPGKRHDNVFKLAKFLQGDPAIAAWPLKKLHPIVDRWYARAVQAVGPGGIKASADDNWFDFAEAWDKVKYPGEEGLMTMLLERAKKTELPAVATDYQSPEIRLLIALCRELQRESGDEPFYLSTATVDRLFGLNGNRMRAWRWLQGLVRDGVLAEVEKGDPVSRRASRFRYLGDS